MMPFKYNPFSSGNITGNLTVGGAITGNSGATITGLITGYGGLYSGVGVFSQNGQFANNNIGATIFLGNGVPAVGIGANGDFFLRTDGTEAGHTVLYHKEAGAWVATAA